MSLKDDLIICEKILQDKRLGESDKNIIKEGKQYIWSQMSSDEQIKFKESNKNIKIDESNNKHIRLVPREILRSPMNEDKEYS